MDDMRRKLQHSYAEECIARFNDEADSLVAAVEHDAQERINTVDPNARFADKEVAHYQSMAALMWRISQNNKARHAKSQRRLADR